MSGGAVTTPHILGWTLTGVGLVVSLGWNFFNHSTSKRLRVEQYRLTQWKEIKSRIERTLDDFVDASKVIVHQTRQLRSANPGNAQIDVIAGALIDAQDNLALALEDAASSQYCDGIHWREAAHGPLSGTETSWDRVLSIIEQARAASSKAEKVEILLGVRGPIGEMRAQIISHCRAQDLELDPERG